jgi:uncharacterized protein (TIGR00296 family)
MKAKEESAYVRLARGTIENYIKQGKVIAPPKNLPEEMINQKAGVFVSLKKNGNLRGCIGTFMPTQENIAQEIIKNAISAAVDDPRFSPVIVSPDLEGVDTAGYQIDIAKRKAGIYPDEKVKLYRFEVKRYL